MSEKLGGEEKGDIGRRMSGHRFTEGLFHESSYLRTSTFRVFNS